MIKQFKIFESQEENMKVLGKNTSYWSWEYDSNEVIAKILLDADNSLYLKISKKHTKTGLGAGQKTTILEFEKIGTLYKPDLKDVKTLLKKHANDKSSAGHGFSQRWKDEEGNEMSLSELISLNKPETPEAPKLKHIQTKSQFDNPSNDIEIVQYSDRAYAIFGMGTKAIKDQLMDLGCRYNKFLTDPKTGQKRAGWICSINKIEKIKKLI